MINSQIPVERGAGEKIYFLFTFFLFLSICFSMSAFAATIQADDDSSWIVFTAAQNAATPRAFWSADSYACCTFNETIFTLTLGSTRKIASNATCGPGDTTTEDVAITQPQLGSFSWVYESCTGLFHGDFSYMLENHKKYIFYVDWVNNGPQLYVVITDPSTTQTMLSQSFMKEDRIAVDTTIIASAQTQTQSKDSTSDQSEL